MTRIAVLDYGFGNVRSVERAIAKVGGDPLVTRDPVEIDAAGALVVPGVGAFAACVTSLRTLDLDREILSFARSGRPVLGVCLGMQVLFERGEEGPADGLGLLAGDVVRLPRGLTVPHMGWNEVSWAKDDPLLEGVPSGTRFYFVHSYVCRAAGEDVLGRTDYGGPFASAVQRDNLLATQFHPEKSGDAGLQLYRNLVERAA